MNSFKLEVVFNQAEALLWLCISLGILVYSLIQKIRRKPVSFFQLLLIPSFALFGFSDLVEAQTGAWWRPWWLLVIKAACIVSFLICFCSLAKKSKNAQESIEE